MFDKKLKTVRVIQNKKSMLKTKIQTKNILDNKFKNVLNSSNIVDLLKI